MQGTDNVVLACQQHEANNNNNEGISRVSDQNGISLLYIILEIHHSGRELSISRAPFHVKHAQLC